MPTLPVSPLFRAAPGAGTSDSVIARLAALGCAVLLLLVAAATAPSLPAGPSVGLVFAGGLAGLAVLALAVARYDTAVLLGLLLLPVVKFEPAPSDAVFALVIAVTVATGRMSISRVPVSVLTLVGLLIVINIVSCFEAVDLGVAARFFGITLYLAVFALWLCSYVNSEKRARQIVIAYLIGAVGSALLGSLALNAGIPGRDLFIGDGATRASALFKDPNVYGPFLVPIAAILLEERFRPRLLHLRGITSALLLAILATGVLFSYSRAAWANFVIACTITVAVCSLRRGGMRRASRAMVAGLAVLGLAGAVIGASGSIAFIQQRAKVQSYDSSRFGAQRAGVELVSKHPAGVGPGQFGYYHSVETHSTYVRVLAEQGYLGLATWMLLVLTTLAMALRNAILGRSAWGIGPAALLGAWCGLMFNSAVVDTLHWRHLWLVAGLIWVATMRRSRAQSNAGTVSLGRERMPT